MVKKDFKELDEAIRGKIQPFLYNQGEGKKVPIAQLACLRNRDRPKSRQVSKYAHVRMKTTSSTYHIISLHC